MLEHRLGSCGTWAQLLQGIWDLPELGIEPVSPALAGEFFTTEPPGKPSSNAYFLSKHYDPSGLSHLLHEEALNNSKFCEMKTIIKYAQSTGGYRQ